MKHFLFIKIGGFAEHEYHQLLKGLGEDKPIILGDNDIINVEEYDNLQIITIKRHP